MPIYEYILILTVPFALYSYWFKKNINFHFLGFLLIAGFFEFWWVDYYGKLFKSNEFPYNMFMIICISYYHFIGYRNLPINQTKIYFNVFLIVFWIYYLVNFLFVQGPYTLNNIPYFYNYMSFI